MVDISKVKWGGYKGYEGPYFYGSKKFVLPSNPTDAERAFDVITRTEGGAPDAVNGYDRCVISTGYIQWCEAAYFLTSKLLGGIADADPKLLDPLKPVLEVAKAEFKKNHNGKWRFFFHDSRGEVDAKDEQLQLFFLNAKGTVGSWDESSKDLARLWVSCLSNTLIQKQADSIQVQYTTDRLMWFVTSKAKQILWSEDLPNEEWIGAIRTAFLSYSANLPAEAEKQLIKAVSSTYAPKWSKDWCISVLQQLTFGPKIAIYPDRYNKIRGYLEKNYGVDLPDFAEELKKWKSEFQKISGSTSDGEPQFFITEEIQELLINLGYDLGPAGADGVFGGKTTEAVRNFQRGFKLLDDGVVGKETRANMLNVWRGLHS